MSNTAPQAHDIPLALDQQAMVQLLTSLASRVGVNPDHEITMKDLAKERNVHESTIRNRVKADPIWAMAFFPVGKGGELRTTMRRIWEAEDKLALRHLEANKKFKNH